MIMMHKRGHHNRYNDKIYRWIKEHGYTLNGVSRKLGVRYETFQRMLRSPYTTLTLEDIDRLHAILYNVSHRDIVLAILEVRHDMKSAPWFDWTNDLGDNDL